MKKLITIFIFCFSICTNAQPLQAQSILALLNKIETTRFEFKEKGLVFGYNSIQSCLYIGKDIAVLKHYCYPEKKYPAKGYKIISGQFGVIDLYEEQLPNGTNKRDILISTFGEDLKNYLSFDLDSSTVQNLNSLIEKLYYKNTPACWSSNYSFYTRLPEVTCRAENVQNFEFWSKETQEITGNKQTWDLMLRKIDSALLNETH
ncbi:MAG: hypothetical protein AABY64_06685 [Bdellovibrionota bacterium]